MTVDDHKRSLGDYVKEHLPEEGILDTIGKIISIDTMNETNLELDQNGAVSNQAYKGVQGRLG